MKSIVCCSELQCVAVSCSELQCVAVCCILIHDVSDDVYGDMTGWDHGNMSHHSRLQHIATHCNTLQHTATVCCILQFWDHGNM